MKLTWLLIATAACALNAKAFGMDENLANCRYSNGIRMDDVECKAFQKMAAEKDARKAADDEYTRKANEAGAAANQADRLERERQRAEADAARAKQDAEVNAEQVRLAAANAAQEREQAAADRKAAASEGARKTQCGADYKKPRIGMPVERVSACIAHIRLTSELNRADGVLQTYESSGARFYIMGGKLVAWGFK